MKKHAEYVTHAVLDIVTGFLFFYMPPALRSSNGIIKQFDYIRGFLMIMTAVLLFTAVDVLIRVWYRHTLKKTEIEEKSIQYIVKVKTFFGTLFVIWVILIVFTLVQIQRSLGIEDLPGNMTLVIASVCSLVIALPAIGAFNYYREKHPWE